MAARFQHAALVGKYQADGTRPVLEEGGMGGADDAYLLRVIGLMKERVDRVENFATFGGYFFQDPAAYHETARKKHWREETPGPLRAAAAAFAAARAWNESAVEGRCGPLPRPRARPPGSSSIHSGWR